MSNGTENLKRIYANRERRHKIKKSLRALSLAASMSIMIINANSYAGELSRQHIPSDISKRDSHVNETTDNTRNVVSAAPRREEPEPYDSESEKAQSSQDYSKILIDNGVSEDYNTQAQEILETLPKPVIEILNDNGWTLYITPYDISVAHGSTDQIAAWADYNKKTMHIGNRNVTDLIHECAHVYDYENDWISIDIIPIQASEYNSFATNFDTFLTNSDGAAEYYAEAFKAYVSNEELLCNSCPETYEFIINSLTQN